MVTPAPVKVVKYLCEGGSCYELIAPYEGYTEYWLARQPRRFREYIRKGDWWLAYSLLYHREMIINLNNCRR